MGTVDERPQPVLVCGANIVWILRQRDNDGTIPVQNKMAFEVCLPFLRSANMIRE